METTCPPADLETPRWLWRSCQVNRVRHDGWRDRSGSVSGSRVNDVGKRDSGSDVENHLNLSASVHLTTFRKKSAWEICFLDEYSSPQESEFPRMSNFSFFLYQNLPSLEVNTYIFKDLMMDPLRCKAGAYFALCCFDKQFLASKKGAGFFLFSCPFYCHTFQFHPQFKGQTEVMLGQNRNANRTDEVAGLLMWRHEEDSNIQYMCKHFFFLQF